MGLALPQNLTSIKLVDQVLGLSRNLLRCFQGATLNCLEEVRLSGIVLSFAGMQHKRHELPEQKLSRGFQSQKEKGDYI